MLLHPLYSIIYQNTAAGLDGIWILFMNPGVVGHPTINSCEQF